MVVAVDDGKKRMVAVVVLSKSVVGRDAGENCRIVVVVAAAAAVVVVVVVGKWAFHAHAELVGIGMTVAAAAAVVEYDGLDSSDDDVVVVVVAEEVVDDEAAFLAKVLDFVAVELTMSAYDVVDVIAAAAAAVAGHCYDEDDVSMMMMM